MAYHVPGILAGYPCFLPWRYMNYGLPIIRPGIDLILYLIGILTGPGGRTGEDQEGDAKESYPGHVSSPAHVALGEARYDGARLWCKQVNRRESHQLNGQRCSYPLFSRRVGSRRYRR